MDDAIYVKYPITLKQRALILLTTLKNMVDIDLDKILIENILNQEVYKAVAKNCPSDGATELVLTKEGMSCDKVFFVNATSIPEPFGEKGIRDTFYPDWNSCDEELVKSNDFIDSCLKYDGNFAMDLVVSNEYCASMSNISDLERQIINESNIEIYDLIVQEVCEKGYSSMATARDRVISLILLGDVYA